MQNKLNPVKKLPAEVARKIAAGEVIDRPNAIVRELLDNSVDSGADQISVEIEGGGIEKIRVTDNGCGMTKEDLVNSILPHATSKIISEQDLLSLSTLGFRGEALSSIASVSRLEISSRRENEQAWKLSTSVTDEAQVELCSLNQGTVVQSLSIFENFPARRVFLKRPASEGVMCKQTFVEKSLAYPGISFKFFLDGKLRLDLVKTSSQIQRVISALELSEDEKLFHEIKCGNLEKNRWQFSLVIGEPSVYRTDRKNIHVFVNERKINEYSLIQAIEYGVQGSFPNGTHPVACLFLQIDPHLVDFNIHPAKKEARFKDLSEIHHAISTSARNEFFNINLREVNTPYIKYQNELYESPAEHFFQAEIRKNQNQEKPLPENYFPKTKSLKVSQSCTFYDTETEEQQEQYDFKYLGSAFNVFLLAEKNERIYVIDQHAGHERILYEQLLKSAGEKQPLLFPYEIIPEDDEQNSYLEKIKNQMDKAGFSIEKKENSWLVTSIPVKYQGTKQDLVESLFEKKYEPEEFMHRFLATCACKAAVKEGHYLDGNTAKKLIKEIFELKDPHCPHGRPVYFIMTREEMYSRVKRT